MPKLSIIVLSYNTAEITSRCLISLYKSLSDDKALEYEVIVVDNASTDDSLSQISRLRQNYGGQAKLKTIFNKKNVGYPRGNNQALKIAQGKYILFLNSDVIIDNVRFGQLLNYFDSRKDAGVITVRVNLSDETIDPASHRGFPTLWNSFCYFLKLEKLPGCGGYHLNHLDLSIIHEIDSPSGAFYLVRKDVLDEIGGFDEDYFMYGEDIDLSFRIKKFGYKIVYYPLFQVTHLKYASGLKKNNREVKKHFYNAMKIFYKKHYENKNPWILNKIVYFLTDLKNKFS